jgi:hypothetical protein
MLFKTTFAGVCIVSEEKEFEEEKTIEVADWFNALVKVPASPSKVGFIGVSGFVGEPVAEYSKGSCKKSTAVAQHQYWEYVSAATSKKLTAAEKRAENDKLDMAAKEQRNLESQEKRKRKRLLRPIKEGL